MGVAAPAILVVVVAILVVAAAPVLPAFKGVHGARESSARSFLKPFGVTGTPSIKKFTPSPSDKQTSQKRVSVSVSV